MTCRKCKGLMIEEWRSDFSPEAVVKRCINCGLILDPLIERNRLVRIGAKRPVQAAT